jgi:Tol biopolymer transport system component
MQLNSQAHELILMQTTQQKLGCIFGWIAVLLLVSCQPPTTQPVAPRVTPGPGGGTGWLAISSDPTGAFNFPDGNSDIYLIRTDGSGRTQLTTASGNDFSPAWSPDGSRIVFRTTRDGNDEIYVMNADGSGQTNLSRSPATEERGPDWSPDDQQIAVASLQGAILDIFVMPINFVEPRRDSSKWTNLTDNSLGGDEYPAWSPDGTRIAFHSYRDGNWEIYVMNADGSGQTRLTHNPGEDTYPVWSPDGTRLIFSSARVGYTDIYMINADGTGLTPLTSDLTPEYDPSWSPDGSLIAFTRAVDEDPRRAHIYLMQADGSGQTQITNTPASDWNPVWQPLPSSP